MASSKKPRKRKAHKSVFNDQRLAERKEDMSNNLSRQSAQLNSQLQMLRRPQQRMTQLRTRRVA
ncbi:hypothetical protein D6R99_08310 [Salmonella enterica subsp. enterica]|nr:hypothetical protein [Salmonella enterica subsp. enterica serovar Enteritidis]ECG1798693.1 hypothetical protein [Salmonella enterica subsp. enterica serovar Paratyphi B]ECG3268922.1 hypothetical protein [Salmonella enterica subsp. enterica serovar Infantis]